MHAFLNALILSQLFSYGYHSAILHQLVPGCDIRCVQLQAMYVPIVFHFGGLLCSLLNWACFKFANTSKDAQYNSSYDWYWVARTVRCACLWISLTCWLVGNMLIGSHFSGDEVLLLLQVDTNVTILPLIQQTGIGSILSYIMVHFAGGFFYWGIVGMSLRDVQTFEDDPGVLVVHATTPPLFALAFNAYFADALGDVGFSLYSHRLVALIASPLYLFRLISFQQSGDEKQLGVQAAPILSSTPVSMQSRKSQNRKQVTLKASWWDIGHHGLNISSFHMFYLLSFVALHDAHVQRTLSQSLVFGGVAVGRFGSSSLLVVSKTYQLTGWIHDAIAVMGSLLIFTLFMIWGLRTLHVATAFAYGCCVGMIDVWQIYQVARKSSSIRLVNWMTWCVFACLAGSSLSLVCIGSMWTDSIPIAVKIVGGMFAVSTTLQVAVMRLSHRN